MTLSDSLIRLVDAAPDLGVTPDAIRKWMRANDRRVHKIGRCNAAHVGDLERYAQHRERRAPVVATRPRGWWGVKRVTEALEVVQNTVADLQRRGEIRGVRVGRHYFYDPESVEHYRRRAAAPLVGWVVVADLIREHGWPDEVPYRAAAALGLELRSYRLTGPVRAGRRVRLCVRESDAARLVAHMQRPLSFDGRLKAEPLAELCGVQAYNVRAWAKWGLPFVKCRKGHAWFNPVETLAWMRARHDPRWQDHIEHLAAHLEPEERAA